MKKICVLGHVFSFGLFLVVSSSNSMEMPAQKIQDLQPQGMALEKAGGLDSSLDKMSHNRMFRVQLQIDAPLQVGLNSLKLSVQDGKGAAIAGARLTITPWMPGMGHGVTVTPMVKEVGDGIYEVENIGFSMPGHWQLKIDISSAVQDDKVVFEFAAVP